MGCIVAGKITGQKYRTLPKRNKDGIFTENVFLYRLADYDFSRWTPEIRSIKYEVVLTTLGEFENSHGQREWLAFKLDPMITIDDIDYATMVIAKENLERVV